jgi:hypothetical protein
MRVYYLYTSYGMLTVFPFDDCLKFYNSRVVGFTIELRGIHTSE